MKLFIPIMILLLSGCAMAKIPLTEAGEKVTLVNGTVSLSDLEKYQAVGTVSCNRGGNFKNPAFNIDVCRNDLKNQAALKGADVVVLDNQQLGVYQCPNCITMVGTAYKKK
ncbi:MAG: hypothetical protein WCH62_07645 [Candidatus Omnitrophota bacterium]